MVSVNARREKSEGHSNAVKARYFRKGKPETDARSLASVSGRACFTSVLGVKRGVAQLYKKVSKKKRNH